MESNSSWGDLASHDQELAEAWDRYERLPEAGEHDVLDAFVERKHLTIGALVRIGARLADTTVLAFAMPGGIKFRDMLTGRRWTYNGSEWTEPKVVPAGPEPSSYVIVTEGESDGARLTELYDCDVAILPGGAKYFPASFAARLDKYACVLTALDNDRAGNDGSAKIAEALPQAVRFPPPDGIKDWCELEGDPPPLPDPPEPKEQHILVPAGELATLEAPDVASWFEAALLPIGGQLILHGWVKSFKSFLALDLLASLAQGTDWACFEPTEEPCRVAVIQFEITWPYYKQRVQLLRQHAAEQELFDQNFLTYSPLRRPELVAGNQKQEDKLLEHLTSAGVQVVLLDPIRRLGGGVDLDKENEARKILQLFQRLQDAGITVISCHHDNKTFARQGGGSSLGMTGSGAWAGDADSIVSIALPAGAEHHTCTQRNLNFTLRSGPSIGGRGMELTEDGRLVYNPAPWDTTATDDEEAPAI